MTANLAASIRARLLNIAKREGTDFNQVLVRFALERFLYRLSQSRHADRFLLKGALLFNLWYDMPHRPTRDADLLGFGPSDLDSVKDVFCEIAGIEVEDGITFDPATITVEEIRKETGYAGVRVMITGELARARARPRSTSGSAMRSRQGRSKPPIPCSSRTSRRLYCAPIPSTPSSRKSSMPSPCWA